MKLEKHVRFLLIRLFPRSLIPSLCLCGIVSMIKVGDVVLPLSFTAKTAVDCKALTDIAELLDPSTVIEDPILGEIWEQASTAVVEGNTLDADGGITGFVVGRDIGPLPSAPAVEVAEPMISVQMSYILYHIMHVYYEFLEEF